MSPGAFLVRFGNVRGVGAKKRFRFDRAETLSKFCEKI